MNEEQSSFYENLGRCIAQWSHVEDGLFQTYLVAINPSQTATLATQAGFYAVQSPEGKISVTTAAVRFRLLESTETDASARDLSGLWRPLVKKIEKKRLRRNQLAHFQVLITMNNRPGRRVMLRPALFNPNAREIKPLHCSELKAIARSFGKLSFDLSSFAYGLARCLGQEPYSEAMDGHFKSLMARHREQLELNPADRQISRPVSEADSAG